MASISAISRSRCRLNSSYSSRSFDGGSKSLSVASLINGVAMGTVKSDSREPSGVGSVNSSNGCHSNAATFPCFVRSSLHLRTK